MCRLDCIIQNISVLGSHETDNSYIEIFRRIVFEKSFAHSCLCRRHKKKIMKKVE